MDRDKLGRFTKKQEGNKMEETVTLNGIEYIRKDKVNANVVSEDGLVCCIVRSYGAGVFYGYLKTQKAELNGVNVELIKARRIHYWDGACSLTQLAIDGTKSGNNCRITDAVVSQFIANVIEIIPLTSSAKDNLDGVKSWKK